MTAVTYPDRKAVPAHLWIVGILALAWNGFGAWDYLMSLTQGETYYRATGMSEELIAYYNFMPGWVYIPWTAGIVGALVGTVLLLLQSRYALYAFVISLLGSIASNVSAIAFVKDGFFADGAAVMPALILAICILLAGYSTWLTRHGLLH